MFPVWPCSVWGLPDDPLPNRRCALTAPFHPYLRPCGPSAVYFLLHFPSLTGPRVTRHTTLWSSDFPLWAKAQSDHPSACEGTGYLQACLSHWRFARNRPSPASWKSQILKSEIANWTWLTQQPVQLRFRISGFEISRIYLPIRSNKLLRSGGSGD